jgi:spore maturation protein CgeB
MKVLIADWNSYGGENMEALMKRRGYEIRKSPYGEKYPKEEREKMLADFGLALDGFHPDYVYSFNYFPQISNLCQEWHVPYISWTYDSPYLNIYSYTAINDVNRIFVFDYGVVQKFEAGGIPTVHYMPLGIDEGRYEKQCGPVGNPPTSGRLENGKDAASYAADIAFVGSLYSEPKHRLYDKFASISPFAKGYLDAVIQAQKHVYGENFLEQMITPEIEEEMQKAYPCDPDALNVMTPAQIYSQFVLSRQVTALERREILNLIGERFPDRTNRLYTVDPEVRIPGVRNMGPVEYYNEMPAVFYSSRINLNITLRSILTGIPLRALDIMGAGGFLLTNYQAEFGEYFTPGEDFDLYTDYEDLMTKIEYYLTHEKERKEIMTNGCRKVRTEHTLDKRLNDMESWL